MIDGLLYTSAGDGSVLALASATGDVQWAFVPDELKQRKPGRHRSLTARSREDDRRIARVAYWRDDSGARVIAIAGRALVALDAKNGSPIAAFGKNGRVDLTEGFRRALFRSSGPPFLSSSTIALSSAVWPKRRRPIPARRHPRI
jgi:quinoprotein glucose dehydrogenase